MQSLDQVIRLSLLGPEKKIGMKKCTCDEVNRYYLKFIEPLKSPNLIKSSTKKFDIGPLRSTKSVVVTSGLLWPNGKG
jgi:hypothetical protein